MNILGQLPRPCPLLFSLYCTLIFPRFLFFLPEDEDSRFFQNVGMLVCYFCGSATVRGKRI